MDIEKKNIVIATGGTGGHIFPSVSLSNFLNNEYEIDFITDKRGLKYLRTNKDLRINIINSGTIFSKNIFKIILGLIKI